MIRLLIVLAVIIMILFILRSRAKSGSIGGAKLYRNLILIVILAGVLWSTVGVSVKSMDEANAFQNLLYNFSKIPITVAISPSFIWLGP